MQKKLLAAAVLSAFSGVAAAQSANVTLYGTLLGDFQFANSTGADASAAPAAPTSSARTAASYNVNPANQSTRTRMNPAGSNFGIRGTEDLGNGLQAWFQVELSVALGAPSGSADGPNHGNAPTYRNSAVGLRSATWGSVSVGQWDTPFNVAGYSTMNANGRSGNATVGLLSNTLGTIGALHGGGAWSSQNENAACGASGIAATCFNAGTNFDRRQKALLQWWSPNWSGFEGRVAYAAVQAGDAQTASNRAAGALKPAIWDFSVAYNNGPFSIGYAYERQNDLLAYVAATAGANAAFAINGAGAIAAVNPNINNGSGTGQWQITGAGVSGSRNVGQRLGGKYLFALSGGSSIGIGAMWESLKYDLSYGGAGGAVLGDLTSMKKNGWRLQGNWTVGNHFFGVEYARSNKIEGSITSTAAVTRSFDGSGTEIKTWMLSYNYAFSKRTSLTAYYVNVNNGTNSIASGITFGGIATAAGADPKYYGVNLRHTF